MTNAAPCVQRSAQQRRVDGSGASIDNDDPAVADIASITVATALGYPPTRVAEPSTATPHPSATQLSGGTDETRPCEPHASQRGSGGCTNRNTPDCQVAARGAPSSTRTFRCSSSLIEAPSRTPSSSAPAPPTRRSRRQARGGLGSGSGGGIGCRSRPRGTAPTLVPSGRALVPARLTPARILTHRDPSPTWCTEPSDSPSASWRSESASTRRGSSKKSGAGCRHSPGGFLTSSPAASTPIHYAMTLR